MSTLITTTRLKKILERELNAHANPTDGGLAIQINTHETPVTLLMRVEQTLTELYRLGLIIPDVEFRYHIDHGNPQPYQYTITLPKILH